MNVAFLIPTKDGGEGFAKLLECIDKNVLYARAHGKEFVASIHILINGNPILPNAYLAKMKLGSGVSVHQFFFSGKVRTINAFLENYTFDIIVLLDDDVTFEETAFNEALNVLSVDTHLQVVGFNNQAVPYSGKNMFRKIKYDVINSRSLQSLYEGIDPFLFGRMMVMKPDAFTVPDAIINEDQYLSMVHDGNYVILPNTVFYEGLSSILKHVRRVLRIETGRRQIKQLFPERYTKVQRRVARIINKQRLSTQSFYQKCCYSGYRFLRFWTNMVIVKLVCHRTTHW